MKKFVSVLGMIIFIFLFLAGLLIFTVGILRYPTSRMVMDQFSRDGSMESFTFERYQATRWLLLAVGGVISIVSGFGLTFIKKTNQILSELQQKTGKFLKQLWRDAKSFWVDLTHPHFAWWEWTLLVSLILLAFAGSWIWVKKPMQHDESYTFIAFAQRPFINLISDYHLPNNHLFNTILIHILYGMFGNSSPVIVRLPSLLAGVICVPLTFLWARRQYGRYAGVIAAGFVGYLPWIKLQSTNGRGYMLMAMFTLIMLILGERVRSKKDRFAWVLMVLATVLNFYTLPIALYPFGIVVLWLFVSAARGDIAEEYSGFWRFFRYLVVYGVVTGMLTFLLYSPIFLIGSGWDSFFHNPFVESLNWQAFVQTLPIRLRETVQDWQLDVPLWFSVMLGIGMIFSIICRRTARGGKISLQLCALAALTVIFVVQRPNPWTRIWTFILPVALAWAAAGWFLPFERLIRNEKIRTRSLQLLLVIFLVIVTGLSVQHITQNLQYLQGEKGQEETVTLALQPLVHSDDIVLTSGGFGPAFWYYFDLHGLPMKTIVNPDLNSDWQNLYFVVDDRDNQTPEDLLSGEGAGMESCLIDSIQSVYSYGHYEVFICHQE